jgi:hypothetical protein
MPSPSAIGSMIVTVVSAVEAELPALTAVPAIKPQLVQQITQALDTLKQAAPAFSSSDASGDVAARVSTDLNAVLASLAAIVPLLPPQVQFGFRIAQFVLPTLEAAVQMLLAKKAVA